mgnify:CR=1 FL=1|tara:strand:+ start:120 stop:395 length:276 start_codon:yes stop_codon:yes gene_type:complete
MKWISVDKELPDEEFDALVCCEDAGEGVYIGIGWFYTDEKIWGFEVNRMRNQSSGIVSHWMKLPDPLFCDKCNDTHQIDVDGGIIQCDECR